MQVSKWGNSLAIRLPAAVVEVLGLKAGDQVEVQAANARSVNIHRVDAADQQALARLRKHRGSLPADFKFDRMEANARRD